jgi:heterodisulfide reductase subunit A2
MTGQAEIALTVDGKAVTVPVGATVLAAAEKAGLQIPTLCRHRGMLPSGSCRICMVRVEDARGGRLVASCAFPVSPGMNVRTDTEDVLEARRVIGELLLARCPEIPAVREIAAKVGATDTPFDRDDLRRSCILCGRCVQVCREAMGVNAIDFDGRGFARSVRAPFDERSPTCQECGACAFVCPTGAIVGSDLWGHRPRPLKSEFDEGVGPRPTISRPFPSAVPSTPAIDRANCVHFRTGQCGICSKACPAGAIDYDQQASRRTLEVGAVVLAPGYRRFDASRLGELGFGRFPNVVTSIQFERILSASGPTKGVVQRPSDGRHPKRIAFLQCVGSRDRRAHAYCSAFCCMQATKEAMVARDHDASIASTIFFMDLRAFGKGFESYWERAKREAGVQYVRSQISSVREVAGSGDLRLAFVDPETGKKAERDFDLLVLSVGAEVSPETVALANTFGVALDEHGFCHSARFAPVDTSAEGVFVTGMFSGPKDIPETVSQASATAARVGAYLAEARGTEVVPKVYPPERDVAEQEPRIGIFVCHCGINIAGTIKVEEVEKHARTLPNVVHVERSVFTCSQDSQLNIRRRIAEKGLNRVIVASCTPRTHEPIFQDTMREAGLNPYLFELANIREQCAWVHQALPDVATDKAKEIVEMMVAKARRLSALEPSMIPVEQTAIVVGGGLAGMTAALSLAGQGFGVQIVERGPALGPVPDPKPAPPAPYHSYGTDGSMREHLCTLAEAVARHGRIQVHTGATPVLMRGHVGHFELELSTGAKLAGGAIVVATGALEHRPVEYGFGAHGRVMTQLELERRGDLPLADGGTVVMIQCVGSRDDGHPYCSRVCCTQAIKNALALKTRYPEARVVVLYRDVRAYGLHELLYREAREAGASFLRYDESRKPDVEVAGPEKLLVVQHDPGLRADVPIEADWVVLSAGIEAAPANQTLAQVLKVAVQADGFFLEAHAKLRPVDFASEGLFLAGLAHGPKTADETIAQALAAAGRAGMLLSHGTLEANAVVSKVDRDKCASCLTCVRVCPFDAPKPGADGIVEIPAVACQGCGLCAASCPAKAIQLGKFRDDQILAMVEAFGAIVRQEGTGGG